MEIDQERRDDATAGGTPPARPGGLPVEAAPGPAGAPPAARSGRRDLSGAVAATFVGGLALTEAFDQLGFPGLAGLSAAFALALLAAGRRRFGRSGGARGQWLVCAAVLLAPLAAHAAARAAGLGRPFEDVPLDVPGWLRGPWFPVQAAAALSAALAYRAYRIPFLAAPLAVAVWFAAQDAAPLLLGQGPTWVERVLVSVLCGVAFLTAGVAAEGRTRGDVSFWLYLPGLVAFSGGLITWTGASTLALALVALLHAGLLLASLLLRRRGFAVAGALGLAAATGRLADDLLDATALGFALAAVALAVAGPGLLYHLHHARLAGLVQARLPGALQRLIPPER